MKQTDRIKTDLRGKENRRGFLRKSGGLAALMALPGVGRAAGSASNTTNGDFMHVVFFWLKQDDRESKEKFLTELHNFIDHVDMIRTKHIGTPADTNREVIDNTYSFSLILSFDSKKEHDIYQEHSLHKTFIENASSLWEKVQVYDSVLI